MKSHNGKGPKPMVRTRKSSWTGGVLSVMLTAGTIAPLVLGVSVMEGCKKKAPPPVVVAPPPPQAPPAPAEVDVKSLAQTMKVDRRVSVGGAAKTTDEDLARGVIEFADALARGDDKKFGEMVDPSSRAHVKSLVTSGRWADSTKKIESVRVARIIPGAESPPVEQNAEIEDFKRIAAPTLGQMIPEDIKTAVQKDLGRDIDLAKTEDWQKIAEAMLTQYRERKDAGTLTDQEKPILEQLERAEKLLAAHKAKEESTPQESSSDRYTVTLAVQQPGAAFAMGWVAAKLNGTWVFTASSVPQAPNMPRASDFDAVFGDVSSTPSSDSSTPAENKPAEPSKSGGGPVGG